MPNLERRSSLHSNTQACITSAQVFEKWINREQLAEHLCVSKSFISKMMLEGLPHKRFGRAVRFRLVEVLEWFDRRG